MEPRLLTTVSRSEMAEPSDQVLVLTRGDQTRLEQTSGWTDWNARYALTRFHPCAPPFRPEQILSAPFSDVMNETHVPISHILWSHVWLGIASDEFELASAEPDRARLRTMPSILRFDNLKLAASEQEPRSACRSWSWWASPATRTTRPTPSAPPP